MEAKNSSEITVTMENQSLYKITPMLYANWTFFPHWNHMITSSGVARAFPVGRLAHPEGQNEEENK